MASDFLMCACSSDMCLSGDNLLVKSVCFWNFIVVAVRYCLGQQGGWCQMGVSEASCVDEVRCLCLKLPWFTFDKVRRFVSETSSLLFVIHQMFVSEVDHCWWNQMFVSEISSLALVSQRVCHNCLVPGFTDGAGFLFCDDVVKTENLDWIFLLDVSLLWGWPVDASVLLSTSGVVRLLCDLVAFWLLR